MSQVLVAQAVRNKVNQSGGGFDPLALIGKYFGILFWASLGMGIYFMWPWLRKYWISMRASINEQKDDIAKDTNVAENSNPVVKQSKLDKVTKDQGVQAAAESLANDLGYKYETGHWWTDIFGLKYWTENDKKAADTLIYQRNNFKLVEKCYYVVTRNRNLTADVLEVLDDDELERVRKYIKI